MTKKPPRDVTTEERRLWQFFTRNDKKLHAADAPEPFDIDEYAREQREVTPAPYIEKLLPLSEAIKQQFTPLKLGDYAGVDRRNAQRLKKGKMAIDRVLDLHGFNQLDAFEHLHTSLMQAWDKQQRVLLIVTGKGNRGEGVLRQNLPLWLNAPSIRPFILAFDEATAKDGGGGAFYVLLKRQR